MRAILLGLMLAAASTQAVGRDDRLNFPIADVYANEGLKAKLDPDVKLFFGNQAYPQPETTWGLYTSNRKTNFFNKSDKEACEIAFVSALISLQERALKQGGNAVVGIRSLYRKEHFISEMEYQCGAGDVVGGVTLRGEVVRLP
jgi:hypothetical protein